MISPLPILPSEPRPELPPDSLPEPPFSDSAAESVSAAPSPSESDESRSVLPEYKRFSRLGIIFWFITRNSWELLSRGLLIILFVWLFFFSGFTFIMRHVVSFFTPRASAVPSSAPSAPSKEPVPSENPQAPSADQKKSDVFISYLSPSCFVLANGQYYGIADVISPDSPFYVDERSKTYVQEINFAKCSVTLSDGRVYRLRQSF